MSDDKSKRGAAARRTVAGGEPYEGEYVARSTGSRWSKPALRGVVGGGAVPAPGFGRSPGGRRGRGRGPAMQLFLRRPRRVSDDPIARRRPRAGEKRTKCRVCSSWCGSRGSPRLTAPARFPASARSPAPRWLPRSASALPGVCAREVKERERTAGALCSCLCGARTLRTPPSSGGWPPRAHDEGEWRSGHCAHTRIRPQSACQLLPVPYCHLVFYRSGRDR